MGVEVEGREVGGTVRTGTVDREGVRFGLLGGGKTSVTAGDPRRCGWIAMVTRRGRARASSRAAALHRGGATAASGSGGLRVSETAKGLRVVAVVLVLAFFKFLIACGILY
jgi:hypothetical protein